MKMKKKECSQRTKVVVRHLPPSLSQFHLFSQFDHLFSHRYNWFSFHPGNSSQKHQTCSRAYIDFKSPGDVLEFADFFHGHTFVNEKGSQFKAIVEYAPSQRVPKPCTVMDAREWTIYRDPDYLEFLKLIAKPVKNLPRTETQFERKEAEQSAAAKESPITTPLMEYVRQKRAAEGGNQGPLAAVKGSKRAGSASVNKPGSRARGAQKKKYILKSSTKNSNQKNMSATLMAPKRGDQPAILSGKEISEIESVSSVDAYVSRITLTGDSRKKKIPLLKGKEHEISAVSRVMLQQSGNSPVSSACKENQRFKTSERLIRSILLNNEACQSQSLAAVRPRHKFQKSSLENDKRSPRPMNKLVGFSGHLPSSQLFVDTTNGDIKRTSNGKFLTKDRHSLGSSSGKQEKNTRINKRLDHGVIDVWVPLCHSDVQHDNEKFTSIMLQRTGLHADSVEDIHGERRNDMHCGSHTVDATGQLSGSNSSSGQLSGSNSSSVENGSSRHFIHHLAAYKMKDNSSLIASERKSSRRGGASSYAVHEKQVWVQKSSSGS